MKKQLTFNSLALLSLVLLCATGCKKEKSIIKGQLPATPESEAVVYLRDYKEPTKVLDSVILKNEVNYQFEFDAPQDSKSLWVIQRPQVGDKKPAKITFIPEKGQITINEDEIATGTPLNDELATFERDFRAIMQSGKGEEETIQEMLKKSNDFLDKHADHPMAIIPFNFIASYAPDLATKMDAVKKLDGRFDDYQEVANNTQMIKNLGATSAGEQFKDFDAVLYTSAKAEGKAAKISDFLGKGQYVLVDFFASWCPPCRAEIKDTLKPLYKEFRNKGLAIVGVSVSDKLEDNLKCIETLGIEWPVMYDAENAGANLYGITTIPMIMLVAPDGKIVARNIYGDEVREAVEKAFK